MGGGGGPARSAWAGRFSSKRRTGRAGRDSLPFTLPGYVHDVGAAFFPFGEVSPALRFLDLKAAGLEWRTGVYENGHPAPDGTCASIARDPNATASLVRQRRRRLATAGTRWQHGWAIGCRQHSPRAIARPGPAWRLGFGSILGSARAGLSSTSGDPRGCSRPNQPAIIPAVAACRSGAGGPLGRRPRPGARPAGGRQRLPRAGRRCGPLPTPISLRRFTEAGGPCGSDTHVDRSS